MGVHVVGSTLGEACLYDSVTMWAFGPIFGSREGAEDFLRWLGRNGIDPRDLEDDELRARHTAWSILRGDIEAWDRECCSNPEPVGGECQRCGLPVDERGFYRPEVEEPEEEEDDDGTA